MVEDQVPKFDVGLTGCRTEPLASYLKALGVLRLVADQKDPKACGFWQGENFVIRSKLDRDALIRFFVDEWWPTPVVAPWNGGSGFYPKDNREAADTILESQDPRLSSFAASINVGRSFVAAQGWTERPADADKVLLLSTMRAKLPDDALAWLDAAVVLGDNRLLFPPLLGTGGNDGRLDFSNNFQQRVVEVIAARVGASLESSLFGDAVMSRFEGTMGQYQPAANRKTNPWDFVLLIEGALMFAAAATRRFETASATMAFPFHARAAGGLSVVTDSDEGESRDELWLPLWSSAATIRDVRRLFAEGRATVGSGDQTRAASSGLDFARAVASLGVDRGIRGFVRVGFHARNGLAYFATPLGRFATGEVRSTRLLDDIDVWFGKLRRKSSGKGVPTGVALACRRLEQAMFDAVRIDDLGPVLLELGDAELALAHSLSFATKVFLDPVPLLPATWADATDVGRIEQRLAAALATRPGMRSRLIPLDRSGRNFGRRDEPGQVFTEGSLVENLHALMLREDVESQQQERPAPKAVATRRCSLTDVAHFIDGNVDDFLLGRWLHAFTLIDGGVQPEVPYDTIRPPTSFALLSLVHHRRVRDIKLPRTAGMLALACAGDSVGATTLGIRRLNANASPLPVAAFVEPTSRMRRVAAALAFPLSSGQRRILESMVLPLSDEVAVDTTTLETLQEQA